MSKTESKAEHLQQERGRSELPGLSASECETLEHAADIIAARFHGHQSQAPGFHLWTRLNVALQEYAECMRRNPAASTVTLPQTLAAVRDVDELMYLQATHINAAAWWSPMLPLAAGPAARREPTTKQSVTIPESTWAAVEALAEAEGISRSAWLSRAADQAAAQQIRLVFARQAAQEHVAEYEDEHGPISDEARAAAREALGLDDEGAAAA